MRGQENCSHPEERWHRHTDTCGLCGIALRKVRMAIMQKRWDAEQAARPPDPTRRSEQLASEAAEQAHRLTGRVPYAVVTPRPEGGTVYWVMDGKAHQCHWVGGAERSVVMDGATALRWQVVGGRVSVEAGSAHSDAVDAMQYMLGVDYGTGELRVEYLTRSEALQRYRSKPDSCGPVYAADPMLLGSRSDAEAAMRRATEREPPAVGAEVSWAEAERDMRARPGARYQHMLDGASCTLRVDGGRLMYWDTWHTPNAWRPSVAGRESCERGTWQRLPDATDASELPAIGAEVSWSEAKADMQRRREAMYRTNIPQTGWQREYMWSAEHGQGSLVFRVPGGLWEGSQLSQRDLEDPLRRWVRLA